MEYITKTRTLACDLCTREIRTFELDEIVPLGHAWFDPMASIGDYQTFSTQDLQVCYFCVNALKTAQGAGLVEIDLEEARSVAEHEGIKLHESLH